MTVYVAVADFGLNGAGVIAAFGQRPSGQQVEELIANPGEQWTAPLSRVTGWGGIEVVEMEVR